MLKKIYNIFLHLFAIAGLVLVVGFLAIKFNLTNVSGMVDKNSAQFQENYAKTQQAGQVKGAATAAAPDLSISNINQEIDQLTKLKNIRQNNFCAIRAIGQLYPGSAERAVEIAQTTSSDAILIKTVAAYELKLQGDSDFQNKLAECENGGNSNTDLSELKNEFQNAQSGNVFSWIDTPEWQTVKEATDKDKDSINRAGVAAGIEPRLIVSDMIVEQMRLFFSDRETFKKFFEPLKILCSEDKISLGVMGIKEATAIQIENNLKDPNSPYYPGKSYEHLLDFQSQDITSERYNRLTNEQDHYYSYLYAALYLKEILSQWKNAGYDISYRPEIIGTLYNVGFPQSKPNPDPKVGGSSMNINGQEYSFGDLSYEFYYSGELINDFPYQVN